MSYEECKEIQKFAVDLLCVEDSIFIRYEESNGQMGSRKTRINNITSSYIQCYHHAIIRSKENVYYDPDYGYYIYL